MQKRRSRIFSLAIGLPLLLALLAACGGTGTASSGSTPATNTVIKVATELPISGGDIDIGTSTMRGAQLAVDQANANHTIPNVTLQFVAKDDVGPSGTHDPQKGAANIQALLGDPQVAGEVGPLNSSVALAEMPIANNGGFAMISPANTNPCLTKSGAAVGCTGASDYVPKVRPTNNVTYFRLAATDDFQGPAMADYLSKTLNLKTAFVIDDTEAYGAGLAKYFVQEWTKLGGTVIDGQSHSVKSTTDYTNLLTSAASKHPEAIYFGGNYSTGGQVIQKQMSAIPGLQKTVYAGGDGMTGSPAFYKQITDTNGTFYVTIAAPDATKIPAAAQFVKDYTAKYGALGPYSASAYDSMNILIQAVKKALGSTPAAKDSNDVAGGKAFRQAVINAIKQTDWNGVTGHTTFDTNGDTTNKVFTIYQVALVNGKPDIASKGVVTL
ncbi:MAG TPA: branched-chain amino acid ABC transporter substrate-binding protein [Ktedonobacteraceae bacterium]|nr:branched-chain amino acid ABC transporter substrate-binding protein [Ktedonobacteraceae bacterium]